jgi:hypothetical protein
MLCGHTPFLSKVYPDTNESPSNKDQMIGLATIIQNGAFDKECEIYKSLSDQAKDLVRGLLCVDLNKRYSMENIQNNKWLKSTRQNRNEICIFAKRGSIDLNNLVKCLKITYNAYDEIKQHLDSEPEIEHIPAPPPPSVEKRKRKRNKIKTKDSTPETARRSLRNVYVPEQQDKQEKPRPNSRLSEIFEPEVLSEQEAIIIKPEVRRRGRKAKESSPVSINEEKKKAQPEQYVGQDYLENNQPENIVNNRIVEQNEKSECIMTLKNKDNSIQEQQKTDQTSVEANVQNESESVIENANVEKSPPIERKKRGLRKTKTELPQPENVRRSLRNIKVPIDPQIDIQQNAKNPQLIEIKIVPEIHRRGRKPEYQNENLIKKPELRRVNRRLKFIAKNDFNKDFLGFTPYDIRNCNLSLWCIRDYIFNKFNEFPEYYKETNWRLLVERASVWLKEEEEAA